MRSSLIWVCTVCSDLSVPIFKIITVTLSVSHLILNNSRFSISVGSILYIHAYSWKSKAQPHHQYWVLTDILWFIDFTTFAPSLALFLGMIKARVSYFQVYLLFCDKAQAGETLHSTEFLSGSALFSETCLSQYLESLPYSRNYSITKHTE